MPSESILHFKANAMKKSRTEKHAGMLAPKVNVDDESKAPLLELYEKHNGKLEPIFAELGDHPGKALKYPPEDADEFATKYLGGYYTYIDLKAVMEKAGLEYQQTETASMDSQPRPLGVVRNKLALPDSELAKDDEEEKEEPMDLPQPVSGKLGGITPDILNAKRVTLTQRRNSAGKVVRKTNLLLGPSDDEIAPLVALYEEYEGNMTAIFSELGESPRKALKYPPKDALDFANQFIAGKLTDYAAPKIKEGFDEVMMRPDRATTHFQALASVFPNLPHEVIFAVLEAANGSLDAAVDILLESGLHLWDEPSPSNQTPPPPPSNKGGAKPKPKPRTKDRGGNKENQEKKNKDKAEENIEDAKLSELQERNLQELSDVEEDYVLAINVPPGSGPNALLKITTTIGTVHARVPEGVMPGQSFFIKLRCSNAGTEAEAI